MFPKNQKEYKGLKYIFLVLSVLFISLAVAEFCLRISDFSYYWSLSRHPDPLTGWSAAPGTIGWQRGEGEALVEINADGWRDVMHSAKKEAGIFRIAILGDSFTEAVQVLW